MINIKMQAIRIWNNMFYRKEKEKKNCASPLGHFYIFKKIREQ